MSALGMFAFKHPSLLSFENEAQKEGSNLNVNLKNLLEIGNVPSDTQMRSRLDEVHHHDLQPAFKNLFLIAQRQNLLRPYYYMGIGYLVSLDGTGFFSSKKINCQHCLEKHHRNGTTTYQHQALGAVLVHPDQKQVFPFAPEFISNEDGSAKNDCERNAAKRLLPRLREDHPNLSFIIIEDSLASNAPHIKLLRELNMNFILGVKPGDHEHLFSTIKILEKEGKVNYFEEEKNGEKFKVRFINEIDLNASSNEKINFLEVKIKNKKGEETTFSWVTSITLTYQNWFEIMRGGRARWKIENETFNTLKNQGYNLEHNYGHGNKYLCNTLCSLMFLAFFIDQLQEFSCSDFKSALKNSFAKRTLWEKMRGFISSVIFSNWQELFHLISGKLSLTIVLKPNTS
jgi:hypothetical protein